MSQAQWADVDRYLTELHVGADEALDAALASSAAAGLPAINVSPTHGKLLHLLARVRGARRILEIGTLGGYSTIWMGRALPADGKLISLEVDAGRAELAQGNIARAGLDKVVEVRVGKALETLPGLAREGPFDMVFIDADKVNGAAYFEWALKMSRVGTVIIVDNVVRDGEVVNPDSSDEAVLGTRRVLTMMANEKRVDSTAIQTVGAKGYDGFAMAVVVS